MLHLLQMLLLILFQMIYIDWDIKDMEMKQFLMVSLAEKLIC